MKRFLRKAAEHGLAVGAFSTLLIALAVFLPFAMSNASPARNCDSNAIMNCGAYSDSEFQGKLQNGDGLHSGANIEAIYQSFGIDTSELSQAQDGYVTKSGDVVVGGQTVATGVWTAGRQDIGNSSPHGSVWMRPPSVSFLSDQLDAFVYAPGGHFEWAILKACGNPVYPVGAPFGQIFKRVQDVTTGSQRMAADNDATALTVHPGDTLNYFVTIDNNGSTNMDGIVMTDHLPSGILLNGKAGQTVQTDPSMYGAVAPNGGSKTLTIVATVASDAQNGQYICNTASFTANGGQSGQDQACVQIESKPVQVCDQSTGQIITVDQSQAGNYAPVGSPECQTNGGEKVQVCDITTGQIITVDQSQASNSNYAPVNSPKCQNTTCQENNGNCNVCQPNNSNCGGTQCENGTCNGTQCQNNNCSGNHLPPPTSLPSTGPTDIAGLFAGTSGLGAVSHWLYRRRKFNR